MVEHTRPLEHVTTRAEHQVGQRLRSAAQRVSDTASNGRPFAHVDQGSLNHMASVSVKMRWFLAGLILFMFVYRSDFGASTSILYTLLLAPLVLFNWYTLRQIRMHSTISPRWMVSMWVMEIGIISAAVALHSGFQHNLSHLLYYPILASCAVMFHSLRSSLILATIVALIYAAIVLGTGRGLAMDGVHEKTLVARTAAMYGVVIDVNLLSSFERRRFNEVLERERTLRQEQAEFAQSLHDTTAQSVYMIQLGVDTARSMAGNDNPALSDALASMAGISRVAAWELRHHINMGAIFEGDDLCATLRSHARTFTNITMVPAEVQVIGVEPPLSVETKGRLFSIAHNALTNAYRHAQAGHVRLSLHFSGEAIRLDVSDDGVGLPEDYGERGRGFANMNQEAERLGGRLLVSKQGPMGGASVSCVIEDVLRS